MFSLIIPLIVFWFSKVRIPLAIAFSSVESTEIPYFSFLTNEDNTQLKALKTNLIKRNVIYIGKADFEVYFPDSPLLKVLFSGPNMKSQDINNSFLKLFSLIKMLSENRKTIPENPSKTPNALVKLIFSLLVKK